MSQVHGSEAHVETNQQKRELQVSVQKMELAGAPGRALWVRWDGEGAGDGLSAYDVNLLLENGRMLQLAQGLPSEVHEWVSAAAAPGKARIQVVGVQAGNGGVAQGLGPCPTPGCGAAPPTTDDWPAGYAGYTVGPQPWRAFSNAGYCEGPLRAAAHGLKAHVPTQRFVDEAERHFSRFSSAVSSSASGASRPRAQCLKKSLEYQRCHFGQRHLLAAQLPPELLHPLLRRGQPPTLAGRQSFRGGRLGSLRQAPGSSRPPLGQLLLVQPLPA